MDINRLTYIMPNYLNMHHHIIQLQTSGISVPYDISLINNRI